MQKDVGVAHVFSGQRWQPREIKRVIGVMDTSTKPIFASTDAGNSVVKYLGNRSGATALLCELIGSELANAVGLTTPDFAVARLPKIDLPDPSLTMEAGPAFFSRWEEAVRLEPDSELLASLRQLDQLSLLVVFDTWIRNSDRYCTQDDFGFGVENYDNVLLSPDKRKVRMLVIDHSHALVEADFESEIGAAWIAEERVYGLFPEFVPHLTPQRVRKALSAVCRVDEALALRVCRSAPSEWGMTEGLAVRLARCIVERGARLAGWLPQKLFNQQEMPL